MIYKNLVRRLDGSYEFEKNGMPYHCPNTEEWAREFTCVDEFAKNHPELIKLEQPVTITLEKIKLRKKAEIAAARYEAETSGTTVNGVLIDTGRDSQALIMGAALAAVIEENYSLNWKTTTGFVHLSAPEIIAVAQAVRAHVQACFDREAELCALVDAAKTAEDLDEIIISWPI